MTSEFLDQIYPKRVFPVENRTAVQGLQAFAFCLATINSTVVFEHFEDLRNLIILNILK